jgi:putative ABC transport system substrate-binding protein
MKKKVFSVALAAIFLALSFPALSQQAGKVRRIGYLTTGSASSSTLTRRAFLDGLRQLGYVEGQNVLMEYRYADGRNERLPELAADLVRLKVEVIVVSGTQATLAARNATATIPIVTPSSSDLFGKKLAEELSRPGGNVTGFSSMNAELTGKRLEIFREAFPNVRRLVVLWYTGGTIGFQDVRRAAEPLRFNPISLEVARPEDFDSAFALASRERSEAVFTTNAAFMTAHRRRIIEFAAKYKLPAMYHLETFVDDGGLMSYSASVKELHRQTATYVDKILKGAKPADLPIERPTKLELWINLKTAKQIGVTIPQSVLYRADRVIKERRQ